MNLSQHLATQQIAGSLRVDQLFLGPFFYEHPIRPERAPAEKKPKGRPRQRLQRDKIVEALRGKGLNALQIHAATGIAKTTQSSVLFDLKRERILMTFGKPGSFIYRLREDVMKERAE